MKLSLRFLVLLTAVTAVVTTGITLASYASSSSGQKLLGPSEHEYEEEHLFIG